MNFFLNCSKSQFNENVDENLMWLSFVYHLTISPLWHVYSYAYGRFNWRDGIRYSYISFCAKSEEHREQTATTTTNWIRQSDERSVRT